MEYYLPALYVLVPLILFWILFRYLIRLVKANESIADSLEEISESLKEITDAKKGNADKKETIN